MADARRVGGERMKPLRKETDYELLKRHEALMEEQGKYWQMMNPREKLSGEYPLKGDVITRRKQRRPTIPTLLSGD
jgi:hypothetical protein